MAYIITSKTRRRSPGGRTVALRDPERRETRICDERTADDLRRYRRWGTNIKEIPGVTNTTEDAR